MNVTINSSVPIEIDIDDLIEYAGIENGDSSSVIYYKINNYINDILGVPEDMITNIEEVSYCLLESVKNRLKYYIIIKEDSIDEEIQLHV